jgi:apolipoprotein N-acyltransferase
MMSMQFASMVTDEMSQERAMLAGDFHSGPVTTIRVIGYIGLIFFILAQTVLAVRAHKLIKRSRDTAYFCVVLFFCIQMVWSPLFFIFVMGSFKAAAPLLFIQMGLLRLLETSFANSRLEEEPSDIESLVHKG